MELEFETRTTDYLRQSIEGVCRQEQTLEVIVPDASPDAARVVYCGAQAVVRSRECRSGAIELTGGIQAGAVYLTEADGAPRCRRRRCCRSGCRARRTRHRPWP